MLLIVKKDANFNAFVASYILMLWAALVCLQLTHVLPDWAVYLVIIMYYDANCTCLYRNIRKKDVTKFHIQLALSMLLMLLTNLINYVVNTELNILLRQRYCIFVAFFWYTILVVLMWMGAEGVLLFQKLLLVFKKTTTLYIIVVSLICWGEYMTKRGHHNAGRIIPNHCYQNFCPDSPQRDVSCLFLTVSIKSPLSKFRLG